MLCEELGHEGHEVVEDVQGVHVVVLEVAAGVDCDVHEGSAAKCITLRPKE